VVAGAAGRSGTGAALELEFLALPLAHRGGASTRILGALVPTDVPYWLGAETLGQLTLGMTRYLGPQTGPDSVPRSPPLVPAHTRVNARVNAGGARLRRGLVVYDGGQT
jgi:hypothetical protein